MKKLFTLFALVICLTTLKAQYVTIPDPNFRAWLQLHVSSAMIGNQMDTTSIAVTNRVDIFIPDYGINDLTGVQYFDGLKSLECSNYGAGAPNHLTSLPHLPANLDTLRCQGVSLASLPQLPGSLKELTCGLNLITNLPNLPPNLYYLDCTDNQLAGLPALPSSLQILACGTNQISSLPVLPSSLLILICDHNQISCFPSFPNSIWNISILNNLFTCLPNYITAMDPATLAAYPLCMQGFPANSCQNSQGIVGSVYNDNNLNCAKNMLEQNMVNIPIKLYNNSGTLLQQTTSLSTGAFAFNPPLGSYVVKIDTLTKPYAVVCSNPGIDSSAVLNGSQILVDSIDFSIVCKPGRDLGIQSIVTSGIIFPGQNHIVNLVAGHTLQYYNLSCGGNVSGTVVFSINGPVTYVGPAPGALTPVVSGNTFSYTISDFSTVNNFTDFKVIFNTNTSASLGAQICINATITPLGGDNYIENNTSTYCYNVVNSYDPNIKEVYPVDVQPGFNDWLTYSIHFQNTGNAPAFNIRLADTLDTMLDLETFQAINASHTNFVDLTSNVLNIRFPNIMLPDSTSNPTGSIGYFQYRIKPKSTWAAPYQIKNTAYIYFDYNTPIVTNTTHNSVITVTGLNEHSEILSVIYPNPTNGTFTIELNTKEKQFIRLFDITGNLVLSQIIENGSKTIDAGHLAAGIYNVSITGNSSITNKKLVIVK